MLFDPTERNVDPFLFLARFRTMKELILALAIHDKTVTMAKAAQVSFIVRTGLTSPSENCRAAKTHLNNELGITTFSKQRFVITVPTDTRIPPPVKVQVRGGWHSPSAHQGFIRGAMALHTPASSGQQSFPVCGPIAGPCLYDTITCTRNHKKPTTLCGTISFQPNLLLCQGKKKDSPFGGHHGTPDPPVFSNCDLPSMFLISLPGTGGSEK